MTDNVSAELTAVVDGGTSRTRLRLWDGERIAWEASRPVGASDVARHGRTVLEAALAGLVSEATQHHAFSRMVAFGMITSNVGLCEIPHIRAPARYIDLANAIAARAVPSIGAAYFIPGVKTGVQEVKLADIASFDIMRGEETEVFGMRRMLGLKGPADFFHAGSHHKLIRTDDDAILGSTTTLSGELVGALLKDTILASSAAPLESLAAVDQDWWTAGLQTASAHGFSRAAFCVRLADQLLHASREQATAFLLGAAASLDLAILSSGTPLFLYGHLTITHPLSVHLRAKGISATVVDPDTSRVAAIQGAVELLQANGAGTSAG